MKTILGWPIWYPFRVVFGAVLMLGCWLGVLCEKGIRWMGDYMWAPEAPKWWIERQRAKTSKAYKEWDEEYGE